jgi:hypothetical protein
MMKITKIILNAIFILAITSMAQAQNQKVTPENFIHAETDHMYTSMIKNAGGTNKFFHFRTPTPLDKQTVIRMNRDVLYSGGVFDAKEEITIEFPEMPDDRYASVYMIDNDHYAVDIIHEPGIHKVKSETQFLYLIIRIQVKDPFNKEEVKMVNTLQDQFVVTSKTNEDFPDFKWDKDSLDAQRAIYEKESKKYSSWAGMMGVRGQVNENIRHIAAAAAWGLLPEEEATYINYKHSEASADKCYTATYQIPENKGFWSITVYGDDGFMKSDNNLINASNVTLNKDGTFTAYFGSEAVCGDVPNRVDTTDGWNFLLRVYVPGESVLKGEYKIPDTTVVSK